MARDDLALLALMSLVAVGLSSELAEAPQPSAGSGRALALSLLAVQLLALGVLLGRIRRRRDQALLAELLQYERGLSEVLKRWAALSSPDDTAGLSQSLREIAPSVGAARLMVCERTASGELGVWCDLQASLGPGGPLGSWPDTDVNTRALEGRLVQLPGVLALPLRASNRIVGVLTLFNGDERRPWAAEHLRRAVALADVLAHALLHLQDRRDVRETADFSRAVLASVSGDVAVLDANGVVVSVNASWIEAMSSPNPTTRAGVGMVLLDAVKLPPESRTRLATAVHSVLDGSRPQTAVDYSWEEPGGQRWSEVRIQRLNRQEGGAVLTHLNVTPRKRLEAEVQRHLHELAHVNMRSGMGELAAAVAHELNQPLTAVLSNAQAARRMMMAPAPALVEVREILDDIIEQDKRAGDVIQRIRRILRKDQFDWTALDFNALILDVIRLLGHQAALGGVTVASTLAPDLPPVRGDRVQLQQVVLNLLLNGIQASIANESVRKPAVSVVTGAFDSAAYFLVRDSGAGIPAENLDRIFDPFYTTKTDGFGMGLSISRSIVELHQGQLTAANHTMGGAEFSVRLPAEGTPA
jgi:two-component system sensor kinase FixL